MKNNKVLNLYCFVLGLSMVFGSFLLAKNAMASANGFLTETPTSRYGASSLAPLSTDTVVAQKFTLSGTGSKEISEIGIWASSTGTAYFHLAIFSDTGDGSHSGTIVENSDSGEISMATTTEITKVSYTYTNKPVLTGGDTYWLVLFTDNAKLRSDYNTTGIPSVDSISK